MQKRQFTIYGRVQGVGFRYFTQRQAQKLGLQGYVKNLADGAVLVVAQGQIQAMLRFIDWLHQGPPTARVEQIIEQDYYGLIVGDIFHIKY
ncbi:MAG: acylphosphatase [Pasteurellaceae bacterium]|nr:acylphosphatase [Pasteurellaceae bacterium]